MKKYPILLIAWLLPSVMPNAANANLLDTLRTALNNQCVPTSGEYCGELSRATFASSAATTNKCQCPCKDQYYDESIRACRDCDYGTVGFFSTTCGATSCRAGYVLGDTSVMANGSCSPGYIVQQSITRTCEGGISQGSCPAGFILNVPT